MPRKKLTLDTLLDQEKQLQAAIREAKRKQAEEAALLEAERCRIIGAAVIAELKANPAFAASIDPVVERHTASTKDRKTLGLAPRPKSQEAGQTAT
jgi:L-amino acid N-acyltransferase YncA